MATREFKNSLDAVEGWLRNYQPDGKAFSIKQTKKTSLEDTLETMGTKKNYLILNFVSSESTFKFENGDGGLYKDTINVFIKEDAVNSLDTLFEYMKGVYRYKQIKPETYRTCKMVNLDHIDNNISQISIEVI